MEYIPHRINLPYEKSPWGKIRARTIPMGKTAGVFPTGKSKCYNKFENIFKHVKQIAKVNLGFFLGIKKSSRRCLKKKSPREKIPAAKYQTL